MKNRAIGDVIHAHKKALENIETTRYVGRVSEITGISITCTYFKTKIGDICYIESDKNTVKAEVIGFDENAVFVMLLSNRHEISCGATIYTYGESLRIPVGDGLLGNVINAYGECINKNGFEKIDDFIGINGDPPNVLSRQLVKEWIKTGVKSIDGLLSIGMGQRMGIFAQAGLGKSNLLSLICKNSSSDMNVIVLIGERGREVKEFITDVLGDAIEKSVVIVSTSNESPLSRVKSVYTGITIAEYFRNRGKNVMFIADSITRLAMAQREIGASLREAPISKGYTPSVFSLLSNILERATNGENGTITSFFSVLLEDEDGLDIIGETVKGILDGHIILSKDLFSKGHFPAIDVKNSVSRLMGKVVTKEHLDLSIILKKWISAYDSVRDILNFGAYVKGQNIDVDEAIDRIDDINAFLQQRNEVYEKNELIERMKLICGLSNEKEEDNDLMSLF